MPCPSFFFFSFLFGVCCRHSERSEESLFCFSCARKKKFTEEKLFHLLQTFAQRFSLTLHSLAITMHAILGQQAAPGKFLHSGIACRRAKCYKANKRRIQKLPLCLLKPLSNARCRKISTPNAPSSAQFCSIITRSTPPSKISNPKIFSWSSTAA